MRIKGSGGKFGSFGGGGSRSDSFRKKHRLGQKVKGVLLKNIADGMAWVSIDGDRLLAQLENIHSEGARLTFLIKQLVPDIILKEVFEFDTATSRALGMASSFDASRTLFENRFHPSGKVLAATAPPARQRAFIERLAMDPTLYAAFMDTVNCARTITYQLQAAALGRILYQPWLTPEARRQLTFIKHCGRNDTNPLAEAIVEFEHESWGMARVEFLHKHPKTGYKLKLQYPRQSQELKQYLATCTHPHLTTELDCIGVTKLPPNAHGGILAEIMFRTQ